MNTNKPNSNNIIKIQSLFLKNQESSSKTRHGHPKKYKTYRSTTQEIKKGKFISKLLVRILRLSNFDPQSTVCESVKPLNICVGKETREENCRKN